MPPQAESFPREHCQCMSHPLFDELSPALDPAQEGPGQLLPHHLAEVLESQLRVASLLLKQLKHSIRQGHK
eukprot:scaffold189985_cov43-Prasinocladus_malaysianus.AAC.2